MQKALPILFVYLLLNVVGCAGDGNFPELKPCEDAPSGYHLTFNDGPDFYVWEVNSTSDLEESAWAMVYFGLHPDPQGRHSSRLWEGDLAGHSTFWSVWPNDGRQLSEALVDYRHDRDSMTITLHSIVSSPNEDDLAVLRQWMGVVSFCQRDLTD